MRLRGRKHLKLFTVALLCAVSMTTFGFNKGVQAEARDNYDIYCSATAYCGGG